MEFDFEPAYLPKSVESLIIPHLQQIQGTWKEIEKPKDDLLKFLARLGVGGIKRRLVVNAESNYEIQRLWPPITDFTKTADEMQKTPKSDTESNTEATTEPSSPVRSSEIQARWYQKQYFPFGKFVDGEILAGSNVPVEQVDPETGSWLCIAKAEGDIFYQKRFSAVHNVTMYETRALVNRKFNYASDGTIEFRDEEEYTDGSLMLFQWTMIDHNNNDEKSICYFFLKRVNSESE